jgi:hypothetical protein
MALPGTVPQSLADAGRRRARRCASLPAAIIPAGRFQMNTPAPGISAAEIVTKPRFRASLPLDASQTDEIPVHLRRLVALRDQG